MSKALEILIDASARSAYDKILKARKATEIRNRQLDSKRQKLKADLEARERAAQVNLSKRNNYHTEEKTPEEIFKEEVERLRKEGSRLLEEEQELMRQQLRLERLHVSPATSSNWDSSKHRIKIRWNAEKGDPNNGGYNQDNLTKFLHKYGDIVALIISSKKPGSGLVEFKTQDAAEMAIQYEKGILENPLKFEWIGDAPKSKKRSATVTDTDFESLVLRQLRQAEERKRLIEQMMKEDDEN